MRGFELPKGINAILPIFLQGLMNGTADQRVQAALGISDIIDRTSEASLKPFVTQITGPLIRVVSERATEVKSAILLTLNNLLDKMPAALKPFLPQLQRTFAKSLADPSSETLRTRAAKALGTLIKYTPRIDPLIAELVTGSKTADAGVKTAMLKALYEVISKAGANMGEASRASVLSLIDMDTDERDETMTITNAKLLGALIKNVPEEAALGLLKNRVATTHFTHSSVLALNSVLAESPDALLQSSLADDLPDLLCQGITNKNVSSKLSSCLFYSSKLILFNRSLSPTTAFLLLESICSRIPLKPLRQQRVFSRPWLPLFSLAMQPTPVDLPLLWFVLSAGKTWRWSDLTLLCSHNPYLPVFETPLFLSSLPQKRHLWSCSMWQMRRAVSLISLWLVPVQTLLLTPREAWVTTSNVLR